MILGVAAIWDYRKGLEDFVKLSELLKSEYQIVLVGLTQKQKKKLPENIIGFTRTNNVNELRELYAMADVFVNPTYEDNFPTTNIEAIACGTPVITYETGGSPEGATIFGISISQKCIGKLAEAVEHIDKFERKKIKIDNKNTVSKYINRYNR